jgi:hypothetical protein
MAVPLSLSSPRHVSTARIRSPAVSPFYGPSVIAPGKGACSCSTAAPAAGARLDDHTGWFTGEPAGIVGRFPTLPGGCSKKTPIG